MCTADLQKEGVDEDDVEGITFFSSKKALSADTEKIIDYRSERKRPRADMKCRTCTFEGPQGVCEMCGSHNNGYDIEPVKCDTCDFVGPRGLCGRCGGHTDGSASGDDRRPAQPVAKKQCVEPPPVGLLAGADASCVEYDTISAECRRIEENAERFEREKEKIDGRKLIAATTETISRPAQPAPVPPPPPQAVHGKYEDGSETYRCKVCHGWWDGDGAIFCSRCVATKSNEAKAARNKLDNTIATLKRSNLQLLQSVCTHVPP